MVIGRNEGERLRTCLGSLPREAPCVYVDSGSSDGSQDLAIKMGAELVSLDMSSPFTAARARNEGFRRLMAAAPQLKYVQFVDGDCEVARGWLHAAVEFLDRQPQAAVVCGRRRERHPQASVYNLLCDMEWDVPPGLTHACGGDAMMRAEAFVRIGGFRDEIIAGEEPELCLRLRDAGWQIWRLADEMTVHDAAMKSFGQWWKRCQRAGYAYALGAYLHGGAPHRHWVRECWSAVGWGLGIPFLALGLVSAWGSIGLVALAAYPLQVARLALTEDRGSERSWRRAFFLVLGKFPEVHGEATFVLDLLRRRQAHLIEYK